MPLKKKSLRGWRLRLLILVNSGEKKKKRRREKLLSEVMILFIVVGSPMVILLEIQTCYAVAIPGILLEISKAEPDLKV